MRIELRKAHFAYKLFNGEMHARGVLVTTEFHEMAGREFSTSLFVF